MYLQKFKHQLEQVFPGVAYRDKGAYILVCLPKPKSDGDSFSLYLINIDGGWVISDGACLLNDCDLHHGNFTNMVGRRAELLYRYLNDIGANLVDNEIVITANSDNVFVRIEEFEQSLHKIYRLLES